MWRVWRSTAFRSFTREPPSATAVSSRPVAACSASRPTAATFAMRWLVPTRPPPESCSTACTTGGTLATARSPQRNSAIRVGIVLGSDSDLEVMLEAVKVLDTLQVGSEVVVASAHRTPKKTEEYASTAEARGLGVLIAAAGGAAALPGVLAASSALPVIGVPIAATPLAGMDALLSIVQMPKGVPVATVAIGSWGAVNAAILAAQILAVGDAALRRRLAAYRATLAAEVEDRARRLADQLKSLG